MEDLEKSSIFAPTKKTKTMTKDNDIRNAKAVVFDLDGTLLDTLEDLAASTNHALRALGFPERTIDEVRRFVGNGVGRLIDRAMPEDAGADERQECLRLFKLHYVAHCRDHTRPYPGVLQMLRTLRSRGLLLAIVSNKLQQGVDELHATYFGGLVDVAIGERPGVGRKPAPDMLYLALERLGVSPGQAVYVGDSEVDIETAANASVPCISVTWGFRTRELLASQGATVLAASPDEVVGLVNASEKQA